MELRIPMEDIPSNIKYGIANALYKPKIAKLLLEIQGWPVNRVTFFGKILMEILNRRTGKKNCLWLHGKSNAGKSQMMESLIKGLCPGLFGMPLGNVRSNFMFGNCASKRVIFWEEPVINNENIEMVKCLFAGGPFSTEVKYKDNIIIDPTPCVVTSNKPCTAGLLSEASLTIKNRVFSFYMGNSCEEDVDLFPITFDDWKEFYYWLTFV